ncbi:unnamed protein product [Orchesella dallaii]|uniref:Peptidase S1 domain-containing protein n=1 Tax=Orchesella dallaii TaxID=48710 RepID=A0ABP1PPI1_9HEXA
MRGSCSHRNKEEEIVAELKEKYKWDWGRLFSWDMFSFGDIIKGAYEPEHRSPFGANKGKISRNRSLDCTCGLSGLHVPENNGTNGSTNATTGNITTSEFPWLVFIYVDGYSDSENTIDNKPICSGTIINDKVILTAASCLVDTSILNEEGQMRTIFSPEVFQPDPEDVFVLRPNGTTVIDLSNETTFTRLEVAQIFYNRQFFYSKLLYDQQDWDIAFLVLRQPLIFNDSETFTPICLPSKYFSNAFMEGVGLFSVGWLKVVDRHMATGEEKTTYELKRYNTTYAHPKVRCQLLTAMDWISDRFFCSNGPPFIQAKFIEAHGAPMITESSTMPYSFVQYGIVSWDLMGILHKRKNVRVSTNVSGFLQLIEEFSDAVGAQWCSSEGDDDDEPIQDPNWDEGVGLNEPFILQNVPVSEWNETTTDHRQYLSSSFCQCGKVFRANEVETRASISRSQYTWHIQLTAKFSDGQFKHCSGTVINDRIILTVATCVHQIQRPPKYEGKGFGKILELVNASMLEIRLSQNYFIDDVLKTEPVPVDIKMIVPHVEFRGDLCQASEYDIALIVLKIPLDFFDLRGKVSPVCLPETTEKLRLSESRSDAVVSLRRHQAINGKLSNTLQELQVETLDKEKCKTLWNYTGKKAHKVYRKVSECVKEKFEFKSRFCGAINSENYDGSGNLGHGTPIIAPAGGNAKSIRMVQVGFVSQITHELMKEVVANLSNATDSNPQSIFVYNEIQPCGSNNNMGFFQHPWHVLIVHITPDTILPGKKWCSGTLINDRVILTSALCVLNASVAEVLDHPVDSTLSPKGFIVPPKELRVWITHDMTYSPKAPGDPVGLEIKDVNLHPLFLYSRSFYNKMDFDIALMTLKKPLEFGVTSHSVPVCLPSKFIDVKLVGTETVSTKWHVNDLTELINKQTATTVSEEVVDPSPNFIYNRMRCRVNTETTWISDRFLCTIAPDFSDTQHADLGGALLAKSRDRYTQYGINSWKSYITLLSHKQPVSLATNVAGFMPRIEEYSTKMGSKWCKDDWNGVVVPSKQFAASLVNQKLTASKPWVGTSSSFRNIRKSCRCGRVNSKQKGRIQGGMEATPYEYGWQVQLVSKYQRGSSLCGGALINDRIVLTAAHCVVSTNEGLPYPQVTAENLQVRIMRHYGINQRDDRSRIAKVKAVVPHPDFAMKPTLVNDIAVIVLSKPLDYKNLRGVTSPICMPETGEAIKKDGRKDAMVIGWGRLDALKQGSISNTLQELMVEVISDTDCERLLDMFGYQYPSFLIPGDKVCAGNFKKIWEYKDPGNV